MKATSEALRYLKSRGWSLATIWQTVKDSGMTAAQLADKAKSQEGGRVNG